MIREGGVVLRKSFPYFLPFLLLVVLSRWDGFLHLHKTSELRPVLDGHCPLATNLRHFDPLLRAIVEDRNDVEALRKEGLVLLVPAPCTVQVLGRTRRDDREDAVRVKLQGRGWDRGGWVSPQWLKRIETP